MRANRQAQTGARNYLIQGSLTISSLLITILQMMEGGPERPDSFSKVTGLENGATGVRPALKPRLPSAARWGIKAKLLQSHDLRVLPSSQFCNVLLEI